MRLVDLRTLSMDVTKQEVITKDSVTIQVDAVVFYRIFDQLKSVINIENSTYSTSIKFLFK
jgi:erythrocyte band 7 integral membrane protein